MPETFNNLFEQIYDYENLYIAYREARKDKRFREGVLRYSANLEENLIITQNQLMYKMYEVGDYRRTVTHVPKKRIILILPFRDRVVQWAIYRVLNPIFRKSYISDTYGCIKDRGDWKAAQRLQYWLKLLGRDDRPVYVLEMDIRKYFFRIPHDVIMDIIGRKIKDENVLWLLDLIINSKKQPFGLPADVSDVERAEMLWDVGMPVGSLVSQMVANIVLNELDQHVKRKMQVKHYLRYMDNFDIVSNSKQELYRCRSLIEWFLRNELRLEFSASHITNAKNGIEFAGYRVWADKIHVRKATTLRMKRKLKHIRKQYAEGKITQEKARAVFHSYYHGLLGRGNNESLKKKVLEDWVLTRPFAEEYPE